MMNQTDERKEVIVFEDRKLGKLVAEEICGTADLSVLTPENMKQVTEIFDITILEERKEEDKITSLKGLEYCVNLKQLHLVKHKIDDLQPIAQLSKLEVLNLRGNQVKELNAVGKLTTLRTLVVGQNNIEHLPSLEQLTSLERFYIQENPIESGSLGFLHELGDLEEVCCWETNQTIILESKFLPDHIRVSNEK